MKLPSLHKPSLAALSLLAIAGVPHSALATPPPLDTAAPNNGPGADFPVVLGDQYSVGSTVYTPADVMNYDAVGYAAVVADGGGAVSAAHHTLPLPSYVEVTSLDSGRTILVRVDRRGPTDSNRVIALSPGAAAQLGLSDGATVRVRRVNPPEMERATLRAGGTAPERMATPPPLLAVLKRRLGPDEPVSLTSTPAAVAASVPAPVPAPMPAPMPRASAPAVVRAPVRPIAPQVYAPVRVAPAPVAPPAPVAQQADTLPPAPAPVPFHSYLIRPLRRFPDGSVDNGPSTPAYSSTGDLASPSGAAPPPAYAPAPVYAPPPSQQTPRSYLIRPPAHPLAQPEQSPADGASRPAAPEHARPKPSKPKPKPVRHAAPVHDTAVPASTYSPPAAGSGMLVVQAGAFSVRGRAEEVAAKIDGQVSMSGRMWRVRSGPYASHAEAEAALAKAKAAGYSGARIQRAD